MTPGGSNILDRGMTPEQAREDIGRRDRASWYSATHASGGFGIIANDGREVARCGKEADRDTILLMARSHDAMKAALELVEAYLDVSLGSPSWQGENPYPVMASALALARGGKP